MTGIFSSMSSRTRGTSLKKYSAKMPPDTPNRLAIMPLGIAVSFDSLLRSVDDVRKRSVFRMRETYYLITRREFRPWMWGVILYLHKVQSARGYKCKYTGRMHSLWTIRTLVDPIARPLLPRMNTAKAIATGAELRLQSGQRTLSLPM